MTFLKDYTLSIMVVSVVAILLENLLPQDNNRKYCNVMIGLLVMLVILKPLTQLPHYDETFGIPLTRISQSDFSPSANHFVAQRFEKKLALTISEDLHQSFGESFSCRIHCAVNDEGQITHISRVQIAPFHADVARYISEKYGFKEAVITP